MAMSGSSATREMSSSVSLAQKSLARNCRLIRLPTPPAFSASTRVQITFGSAVASGSQKRRKVDFPSYRSRQFQLEIQSKLSPRILRQIYGLSFGRDIGLISNAAVVAFGRIFQANPNSPIRTAACYSATLKDECGSATRREK